MLPNRRNLIVSRCVLLVKERAGLQTLSGDMEEARKNLVLKQSPEQGPSPLGLPGVEAP